MARKEKLFKSKELQSREEVSRFLRELAEKIESGSLSFIQGDQEINFRLPSNIKVEIEAEQKEKGRKGLQQELEIELKWYEGGQDGGTLELK
jgi:amphi-Trp domain-containing protein